MISTRRDRASRPVVTRADRTAHAMRVVHAAFRARRRGVEAAIRKNGSLGKSRCCRALPARPDTVNNGRRTPYGVWQGELAGALPTHPAPFPVPLNGPASVPLHRAPAGSPRLFFEGAMAHSLASLRVRGTFDEDQGRIVLACVARSRIRGNGDGGEVDVVPSQSRSSGGSWARSDGRVR